MSGNKPDSDETKDLAWVSRMYAELAHYPNVMTTRNEEVRDMVMGAMMVSDGMCPCNAGRVPCPCASIKRVESGALTECRCGLFVRKEEN